MSDLTGRTLGKYRLLEKLGQGGMAQVYRAYQPDLDRYVAIKVLHPHLTADEDFSARFRREARAIAALDHHHIIHVYDFAADQELAFLIIEYLEGNTLKEKLRLLDDRDELMPLEEVVDLFKALAEALDHAHRQGVFHRDVKPSNVLITKAGRPVLTDFGIARIVDTTTITDGGGTPGTPAYMSPEQGKGESGDARSDIYALGVMLYQTCTGRVPFDADTPYAVILKHISAPLPSPRSLRPDLPEAIERVILKAMAKEPDDRYQTAGEMGEALRVAVVGAPVQTLLSPEPRVHWRRIGLGAIVVVAVIALVAAALFARPFWTGPISDVSPAQPLPGEQSLLTLEGADAVADTWLNPDLPDEVWHDVDLVHLQGPLTPDRLLLRFGLDGLPADAAVVTATVTLRVELWGEESFPGAAVAYRVLIPWEPATANFNSPWTDPGLVAGVDFDPTPLDIVDVPDAGWIAFDVTEALAAWQERREPNYGIVVMMSEDSHNWAHHWVYMTEQTNPTDRPTLRILYEAAP